MESNTKQQLKVDSGDLDLDLACSVLMNAQVSTRDLAIVFKGPGGTSVTFSENKDSVNKFLDNARGRLLVIEDVHEVTEAVFPHLDNYRYKLDNPMAVYRVRVDTMTKNNPDGLIGNAGTDTYKLTFLPAHQAYPFSVSPILEEGWKDTTDLRKLFGTEDPRKQHVQYVTNLCLQELVE